MGGSCANRRDAAALACVCRAAAAAAPTSKWRSAVRIGPGGHVLEPASGTFDVTVVPGEDVRAAIDRCPSGGSVLLLPGVHEGCISVLPFFENFDSDESDSDESDSDEGSSEGGGSDEEDGGDSEGSVGGYVGVVDSDESGSDGGSSEGGGSDDGGGADVDGPEGGDSDSGSSDEGGSELDGECGCPHMCKSVHLFGRGRATLVHRGQDPVVRLMTKCPRSASTVDGIALRRRAADAEPADGDDVITSSCVCLEGDFARVQLCDVTRCAFLA